MMKSLWIIIFLLNHAIALAADKLLIEQITHSLSEINKTSEHPSCSLAQNKNFQCFKHFLDSNEFNGKKFNCETVTINNCEFDQCIAPKGLFSSYPEEVALLIPKDLVEAKSLKIHFHGFTTFQNKWDKNLKSLLNSFEFGTASCQKPKEVMIIPFSPNSKNTEFHRSIGNASQFDQFIKEFETITNTSSAIALTLSGHSGGGKVVGNIIKASQYSPTASPPNQRVKDVEIYDGLYAQSWADNIYSWYQSSEKTNLKIYAIKGAVPSVWSNYLLKKAGIKTNITLVEEKNRGGFQHWELNRDHWND